MSNAALGRTLLTFLIAGPPAGALVHGSIFTAYDVVMGLGSFPDAEGILSNMPLVLVYAYIFGALPAVLAGLFMTTLARRGLQFGARLAAAIPVGAIAAWIGLFWIVAGPKTGAPRLLLIAALGTAGAVATVVSSLLVELISRDSRGGV